MYSIGDLAQLGGTTTRTLRHYHDLGLLVPTTVDAQTGYRSYDESQFADLLQILALKELGFSLAEIERVVADRPGPAELRGMLTLRRSEIDTEIERSRARLARVDDHIRRLENQMNAPRTDDVTVTTKRLPAVRLAIASAVSPTFYPADIGPVIQPLYPKLLAAFDAAGITATPPSIAFYDDTDDGGVRVSAGFAVDDDVTEVAGLDIVELPAIETAATAVHHGDMATCDVDTVTPVFEWMNEHGLRTTGYSREVYLSCPDDITQWRTEMQFPVEPVPEQ